MKTIDKSDLSNLFLSDNAILTQLNVFLDVMLATNIAATIYQLHCSCYSIAAL